jgi:hypothetical protein
MKKFLTFLIAGSLSACVTAPPENPWDDLTVETDPAATPVDCGQFPAPTSATGTEIAYDQAGVNELEAYRVCSEANAAIADEHAAQIGELKTSRAALVEAGQSQRNIAEMRQEMLQDERQHHFWQSLGYWVIIIAAVAAL